ANIKKRRYKVFDSRRRGDIIRLILFIIATLTVLKPLADSLRGFAKKKDYAWFLHPVVCFMMLCTYGCWTLRGQRKTRS
ncbi:MAG: hypothetical protein KAI64_04100, partial [Thermoplasmata archaeon]|nr:hypothetical protein [Thermoplasmata archaeon]